MSTDVYTTITVPVTIGVEEEGIDMCHHEWRPDDERPGYSVCRKCFSRRNEESE